jgi:hypothetical protein
VSPQAHGSLGMRSIEHQIFLRFFCLTCLGLKGKTVGPIINLHGCYRGVRNSRQGPEAIGAGFPRLWQKLIPYINDLRGQFLPVQGRLFRARS